MSWPKGKGVLMRASVDQSDILYHEWVPAGLFVRVLVLGLLVLLAVAPTAGSTGGIAALAVVLVLLLAVYWNYRGIDILVTRDAFEARYGLLNRTRIPLEAIQECRPDPATFGRYWGIGVRFGTDGSIAYTTFFGPAVRVQRSGRRPFVVSTRQPEALCAAVREGTRRRRAA